MNLKKTVEGILRSLRRPISAARRGTARRAPTPADKLTRLRHGFGGFGQYRLSTLHIAKSSNETAKSHSLRTPPTTVFTLNWLDPS
jgi:hypothetical protein